MEIARNKNCLRFFVLTKQLCNSLATKIVIQAIPKIQTMAKAKETYR
jgi:hypothetical protein